MIHVPVIKGRFFVPPFSKGAKLNEADCREGSAKQSGNTYFYVPVDTGAFLFCISPPIATVK